MSLVGNRPRQLFVVGAARTGTTALCRYLSMHPWICVLNERFKKMPTEVGSEHFRFSRVLENLEAETNQSPEKFSKLLDSKREDQLEWFGDKGYGYALTLGEVNDNNPDCVFLMTLRNPVAVAASYLDRKHNPGPGDTWMEGKDAVAQAIKHYNVVLTKARAFIQQRPKVPFIVVEYESFYRWPESYEPLLSGALEMDLGKLVRQWKIENERFASNRQDKPITDEEAERVKAGIDQTALAWIKAYSRGQRSAARMIGSR